MRLRVAAAGLGEDSKIRTSGAMRQVPNAKRSRGRGGNRKGQGQGHGSRTQVLDSHGPNIRIRGNAVQIFEKYQQLARDATSFGDRTVTENLLQHAEHYYRIMSANGDGVDRRPGLTHSNGHDDGEAPQGSSDRGEQPRNGQAEGAEAEAPRETDPPQA